MAEQTEKNQAEGKEKPKPTTLEGAVNESWHATKASTNTLVGTGAIAASTKFFGLDGLVTAAAFPVGGFIESRLAKKPFTSKNFRDEAITGALFTPPLWYIVNALREIPKAAGLDGLVNVLGYSVPAAALAAGALSYASIPFFNAIYYPLKYLVDNKTFKGIGKDFKENYWKGTKRSLYLGIPWAATVAASVAMPALYPYLFPVLAGFEVLYRLVLSKENLNYAKLFNPFTYIPNFVNPFYLAQGVGSLLGRAYKGIYNLGSAIGDFFRSKPGAAPAVTPAPKTAPAAAPAHD